MLVNVGKFFFLVDFIIFIMEEMFIIDSLKKSLIHDDIREFSRDTAYILDDGLRIFRERYETLYTSSLRNP